MKKIISILAGITLTASASSFAVSCGKQDNKIVAIVDASQDSVICNNSKVKLMKDYPAVYATKGRNIASDYSLVDDQWETVVGVSLKEVSFVSDAKNNLKKGESVKVNIVIKVSPDSLKKHTRYTFELGSSNGSSKDSAAEIIFTTPKDGFAKPAPSTDANLSTIKKTKQSVTFGPLDGYTEYEVLFPIVAGKRGLPPTNPVIDNGNGVNISGKDKNGNKIAIDMNQLSYSIQSNYDLGLDGDGESFDVDFGFGNAPAEGTYTVNIDSLPGLNKTILTIDVSIKSN